MNSRRQGQPRSGDEVARTLLEVQVNVYDPSFFVAFGFATEAPVTLSGPAIKGCTAVVEKPDPETEENAKALSESFFS